MNKLVIGAVVVVGVAIVAVLVLRPSADEAALRAIVEDGVAKARAGDAEGCIGLFATDYSHAGQSYAAVCSQVRTYVKPGRWQKIDVDEEDIGVEGNIGRAKLKALLTAPEMPYPMPLTLIIHFKKTAEGWKISGYDVEERR